DRIAEAMLTLPPVPTALFGHSFGGCVAFELARRLGAARVSPQALIVGAAAAPHCRAAASPIHSLPEHEFLEAVHRRYGTPRAILCDAELMSLALPSLRSDMEALETYAHISDPPPLRIPLTVLHGLRDATTTPTSVTAWKDLTTGAVATH